MIKAILGLAAKNPMLGPWLGPLQALWPLLWRLLLLLTCFAIGWHFGGKSAEAALAEQKAQLLEAHIASIDVLRAEERNLEAAARAAEDEYDEARNELDRVRRDLPVRAVRLCVDAARRGAVPAAAGATSGNAGGGPERDVPGTPGPDIGDRLYALIDQCDDIGAKLTYWQRRYYRLLDAAKE